MLNRDDAFLDRKFCLLTQPESELHHLGEEDHLLELSEQQL